MGRRLLDSIQGITLVAKTLASTSRSPTNPQLREKLYREVDKHKKLAEIFAEELEVTKKPVQLETMDSFMLKPAESRLGTRHLYCTVGGDGTFLQTSQVVRGAHNLALAINPDSSRSLGALSGCTLAPTEDPRNAARRLARALLDDCCDVTSRGRIITRNIDQPDSKFPLALNEVLLTEKRYNRCLKYEFMDEKTRTWRSFRSSGFAASTRTGSTGLLKSLFRIRQDQLRLLASLDLLKPQADVTADLLTTLSEASLLWGQSSSALRFVHRNLVDQEPLQEEEGWVETARIKNKTYRSILCVDTTEFEIDYDHELQFQQSMSPEDCLHTVHMRL